MIFNRTLAYTLVATLFLSLPSISIAKNANEYLAEGAIQAGIADFSEQLENDLSNEIIFSLATLHFFASIEKLAQSFYDIGLDGSQADIPFLRMPIPPNPDPKAVSANDLRDILTQFYSDLEKTNKILEKTNEGAFIVPIDIGRIRIDLNANAVIDDDEYFYKMYVAYNRRSENDFKDGNPFTIDFDEADAYWLKGYTHLLMSMTDGILAYDGSKIFESAAHLFFPKAETVINSTFSDITSEWSLDSIIDLIAAIHTMPMDVQEPERLKSAHAHLLKVIECSRESWRLIENESDDSREWIPNANQTSVNGIQFSQEMIEGWKEFLTEFQAILSGEKLIPHWRFDEARGINLKKVFFEPQPFDLILWIQGTSALPYLEEGELTSDETWRRLNQLFQGNFIGFALWIN